VLASDISSLYDIIKLWETETKFKQKYCTFKTFAV